MFAHPPPSASATTFANVQVISVDGAGEATLGFLYKDMTVDRLKRAIVSVLRRPAYIWEDMNLYHLGVVMKNDQTLGRCGLFDGAVIRYSFESQRFDRSRQASTASFSNELWSFDSCGDVPFYEEELRTILALDTEQSRTLLGMPNAKMFVENVLLERGLISSR
ncbi:uncharacterized protein LY89DRAFT_738558 [Mollisia scopiformis]|uniref:Ubiquitin-like domain-containing protein n=1 Tax=Mollisia scopiformis TaxID=149040 RepID=A0A194WVC7_MOLSC|nr:uncharacterized protein LY89DRAFT_738558 [Mollisia scopiformis]KUJ11920.1 hypothetical protein LY89DRAFT_738558 [Mollisia scopiformis]